MATRRSWWKLLGAAGLVGVAATGALAVRADRRRRAYSPEQIRQRLHARHAQIGAGAPGPVGDASAVDPGHV